jgi:hypothetical protein
MEFYWTAKENFYAKLWTSPAQTVNGTTDSRGSVTTVCRSAELILQTRKMRAKNGRKEKMTAKETFAIFVLGSIITFFVGALVTIFEMFLWDMTDDISLGWSWKHPERSTIIHAMIMAAINATVFGGGFLAVWLAKG